MRVRECEGGESVRLNEALQSCWIQLRPVYQKICDHHVTGLCTCIGYSVSIVTSFSFSVLPREGFWQHRLIDMLPSQSFTTSGFKSLPVSEFGGRRPGKFFICNDVM